MGDSSCSACSSTASYNSVEEGEGEGGGRGERRRERRKEEGEGGGGGERGKEEGEGEGGGERKKRGRREKDVRQTDEKCSYIPDERIKMQTAGRKEGRTFAGVHGGVDILGGFHELPECTAIFRCYKLTAQNKFNLQ